MEIDLNNVKLTTNFNKGMEEVEEILRNIEIIFTTPVGSVPFDREFGVDYGIVDRPISQAKGLLTIEYIDKVKKYEPRAKILEVTFEYGGANGIVIPKVVIDLVES